MAGSSSSGDFAVTLAGWTAVWGATLLALPCKHQRVIVLGFIHGFVAFALSVTTIAVRGQGKFAAACSVGFFLVDAVAMLCKDVRISDAKDMQITGKRISFTVRCERKSVSIAQSL